MAKERKVLEGADAALFTRTTEYFKPFTHRAVEGPRVGPNGESLESTIEYKALDDIEFEAMFGGDNTDLVNQNRDKLKQAALKFSNEFALEREALTKEQRKDKKANPPLSGKHFSHYRLFAAVMLTTYETLTEVWRKRFVAGKMSAGLTKQVGEKKIRKKIAQMQDLVAQLKEMGLGDDIDIAALIGKHTAEDREKIAVTEASAPPTA